MEYNETTSPPFYDSNPVTGLQYPILQQQPSQPFFGILSLYNFRQFEAENHRQKIDLSLFYNSEILTTHPLRPKICEQKKTRKIKTKKQ